MVIRMLPNIQQRTIEPLITRSVAKGTLINTDEYDIHARLPAWRHQRKTVCHGQGNTRAMKTGMAIMRSTSTPWRASSF